MRFDRRVVIGMWVVALALAAWPAAAQNVSVTSAEPSTGEQETTGLQVRVRGRGFAQNPHVEFLLDDNSAGGITVTGALYVSSSEILATVNIAPGATLAFFDIRVTNQNGRTGRGSDLFQVVQKGGGPASCANEPLDPARFELVGTLNYLTGPSSAAFGPNLGVSAGLRPASLSLPDLSIRTVLVAAVGTPRATGRVEFFVLDASTGAVLDGQPLCGSCDVQSHQSIAIPAVSGEQAGSRYLATGDVNADGIPDFAVTDQTSGSLAVFVGSLTSGGALQYSGLLAPRPASVTGGNDIAMGDLDGFPGDEIAFGKPAGGTKKSPSPAAIYLYRVVGSAVTLYHTLSPVVSPGLKNDDGYGNDVGIGDVTNDGRPDLLVGVPYREVAGVTDAGAIFVHPGIGAAPPYSVSASVIQLSAEVRSTDDFFGFRVEAANADSSGPADVIGLSANNTSAQRGEVVSGPVGDGQQANGLFTFIPRPGVDNQWSHNAPRVGDLNGDGVQDMVLGLPGATTSTSQACVAQGLVYVFLGQAGGGWTRLSIQGPYDANGNSTFGFGVGAADGYPFIVVGNNQFNLGSESTPAGQAFVYRVKNP